MLRTHENLSSFKTSCPDHPGFPWWRSANCQVEAQIEQEQHDAAMVRQRREMQRQIEAFTVGKVQKEPPRWRMEGSFMDVMTQNFLNVFIGIGDVEATPTR